VSRGRLTHLGTVAIGALVVAALSAAPAGAKVKTINATSGPINAPITDHSLNLYPLDVKGKGKVKAVKVSVRISHAFDADLDLHLVSPRGKFVQLSTDNGGSGNNYGSGAADCTGTFTVFDDLATTAINSGAAPAVPPFAGSFKPEEPLASLMATKPKGTWQLVVSDDDATITGSLNCWQLTIESKVKKKK
jgi:subtilisin-like proprotein convertase family protein